MIGTDGYSIQEDRIAKGSRKFSLCARFPFKTIKLTWKGGSVQGNEHVMGALRCSAMGLNGTPLGPPPGEATTAEEYFSHPLGFLMLFERTFPTVEYTLQGDDPWDLRLVQEGVIF